MNSMLKLLVIVSLVLFSSSLPLDLPNPKSSSKQSLFLNSDRIAREKFFPLAAAAYSDNPEKCVENIFENATVHRTVTQLCGNGYHEPENCFAYTAVTHSDRAIIVAFRGSHGLLQLIFEGQRTIFKKKTRATTGGEISNYFAVVYELLMDNGLKQSLQELSRLYPDYEVWVTGHSLGGALAAIAAVELVGVGRVSGDRVTMITFGEPRVGTAPFAAAHDALVPKSYRVTHSRDIVPHIPPHGFEGYHHHNSEIWYNNDMSVGEPYVECDQDESYKCSNGIPLHISVMDHKYYYNVFLSDFGKSGCTYDLS